MLSVLPILVERYSVDFDVSLLFVAWCRYFLVPKREAIQSVVLVLVFKKMQADEHCVTGIGSLFHQRLWHQNYP
jgi:hypothetical protein